MVIKAVLILLFLAMPVMAQDDGTMLEWTTVDSLHWTGLWSPLPLERDTTRYYIKEIKQKCDTIHKWSSHDCRKCRVACSALICTPRTECVDDTTWAPKMQIWLTPIELEQLMKLIRE